MLTFKPVALEDREILDPFMKKSPWRNCDFSFTNAFIWRKAYKTAYAIVDGMLVMSSMGNRFLMPLGDGDLERVINLIEEHTKKIGVPFSLVAVTPDARDLVFSLMPDRFSYKENRDYCDYIYNSDDLINLKGKKYHAKRNHINRFIAENDGRYEYVKIDKDSLEECIEMHHRWCVENNCIEDEKLWQESCAVRDALHNYEALGLKGGAIRTERRGIVAFSLGQPLNDDTFDVCIEKAFYDVTGAYTIINQQFSQNECADFRYINREEDLGVEGLRKAKLSYAPEILLPKGTIIPK